MSVAILREVRGLSYTAAARLLFDTGEYVAWRMDGLGAPKNPPSDGLTWVLLWMDDDEAINPNVIHAAIFRDESWTTVAPVPAA